MYLNGVSEADCFADVEFRRVAEGSLNEGNLDEAATALARQDSGQLAA